MVIAAGQPAAEAFDARGLTAMQAGARLIERYNALPPGAALSVQLDDYPSDLRIWLLEAGIRHRATHAEREGWRIELERALSPAQGSVPGVHHVVTDGESIWACERAERVFRIDAAERRVIAAARVARSASHIVHDPIRDRLFVADPGANRVLALRASDLASIASWDAPGRPQLPLVSVEGIVCVAGGRESGTLTIARPQSDAYVAQTIEVGRCPHDPVIAGDGKFVFVPCAGDCEIVKVRLSDGAIEARYAVGAGPSHLVAHPDGHRIYSANTWDGSISRVELDSGDVTTAPSGAWAHAIDIAPDGTTVWVANFYDDTIGVFDADTLDRRTLLQTERYPHGLDISLDGRYAIATGYSSRYARVYDVTSVSEIARLEIGQGSSHTVFAQGRAFIACSVSDSIACVDLETFDVSAVELEPRML